MNKVKIKEESKRYALAALLHYLFMLILFFMVLFFSLFTELIRKSVDNEFWSVDFPSVVIVIIISLVATLLYAEWRNWVNEKMGVDRDFSVFPD